MHFSLLYDKLLKIKCCNFYLQVALQTCKTEVIWTATIPYASLIFQQVFYHAISVTVLATLGSLIPLQMLHAAFKQHQAPLQHTA
jgi:hypothetical protein